MIRRWLSTREVESLTEERDEAQAEVARLTGENAQLKVRLARELLAVWFYRSTRTPAGPCPVCSRHNRGWVTHKPRSHR